MRRLFSFIIILLVCLGSDLAFPENPPPNAPKAADIITYLRETISWYRGAVAEEQIASEPSDFTFLNDNRQICGQIVRLAFDFARLKEQNEARQPKDSQAQDQANPPSQYQRLAQAAADADLKVEQSQNELQSLRKNLEAIPEKKRPALESLIAETQSELAFHQARRDALHDLVQFAAESSKNDLGVAGLRAQIEELARSVPTVLSGPEDSSTKKTSTEQISARTFSSTNRQEPSGIWGLAADLFQLSHKKHTLNQRLQSTDQLMQAAMRLREPLLTDLRGLIQSGNQLASQTPSQNPTALAQQKKQLALLTAQFKQASAGLLPLSKQRILFNLYKGTLTNWLDAARNEYTDKMQGFLVRLGILVAIIAAIFVAGEAWRRAIFRYVREPRRRFQFLLFRKIVIWIMVVTIVAITFATKLGSVATFAGLITAGVAIALQNVILSVAGYFFLMGKYGVRVGDRVQIGGVTGEVVDIGLVRLHLLELSSSGTDAHPSGRVVAFSNSVVFQPTSSVFRKIPGTSFVWHEINLTFSPESNYRMVQERITTAVDNVLKDHREDMERQRYHMEQALNSISTIELRPKTRLHFTTSGIEVTVRFPVELKNAVDIDDRMMREVYAAIEQEPKLKLVGMLTLRTDISTPTPA